MKAYYDLHIHSVLSACGSELLTPNNILNMCMLKKLNIISITDHNTLKQLSTFAKIAPSYNFLFIYGVEVTVQEGFHVLAYFENLENALKFDVIIEKANPKIPHKDEHGQQLLCDEFDNEIDSISYQLNVPIEMYFEDMIETVHNLDGLVVLAHIDRTNGILEYYQDFSEFKVDAIEVVHIDKLDQLLEKFTYLKRYKILHSSDAHSLDAINEKRFYLELEALSFNDFRKSLIK